MIDYEKSILLTYLQNLLSGPWARPQLIRQICEYLDDHRELLGHDDDLLTELIDDMQSGSESRVHSRAETLKAGKIVLRLIKARLSSLACEPGLLEANLALLAVHLKLDALERGFLGLVLRHLAYSDFTRLLNEITKEDLGTLDACAWCLGVPSDQLQERLRPAGKLLLSGVLQPSKRTGTDLDDLVHVLEPVVNALHRNQGGLKTLVAAILGEPRQTELAWDDFSHFGPMRKRLEAFLRQAVRKTLSGVNILLWGPPGTGKTEFCKALAARLELKLYAVGETDDDGDEPTRRERMGAFRLSQNLLRFQKGSLLMFDEMDDLFEGASLHRLFGGGRPAGSKVFMNRLLEHNPVPTLWVVNDVGLLDSAFIRRMSLAIEIKSPPASVRERVWHRVLEKHALAMGSDELRQLVELNIPPALIDSAARFTRQIDGGAEDFHFASQGIIHAMRGGAPLPRPEQPERFCPELTSADLDLAALTEQLRGAGSRAFSLCLYGPPGTGKSAYLRHLAASLQMPVLLKRASDLLDMYVGNSEKQIAAAFQEALDREALLIFDEADSLLADRRQAVRSWEVSQVNEMLTWMERHPLPFACTTNLMEHLDPASLRRFTFKLAFRFMTREQAAKAFEIFFQHPAPHSLRQLNHLTPGDFAVVRKKADVLGAAGDPEKIVSYLALEEGEKRLSQKSIGFARRSP
ncbi:MAG: AAA family ATPase [Desulfobulbaceae bacterium]